MADKGEMVVRDETTGLVEARSNELATASAEAAQKYQMEARVILAKRFPRDEFAVYEAMLKTCKSRTFAERAAYSFPRGSSKIEGPSINLARGLARLWGNLRYGLEVIHDSDESRTIRAVAWDLESNAEVSAEDTFKKVILRKDKGWVVPDERDLRELTNRRGAILTRNCILQLLPNELVEDALAECRNSIKKNAKGKNRGETVKGIVAAFDGIGVSVEQLEAYLDCKLADIDEDQIADLRGVFQSISDGNSKKAEYFSKRKPAAEQKGEVTLEDVMGEEMEAGL